MKRIGHFLNALQTNWSEDAAARGAAKMTAGAVLIIEGVFGVIRRGVGGGRRRRRRGGRRRGRQMGGLIGSFVALLAGTVFLVVGIGAAPEPFEDEQTTSGEVVDVESREGNEGETRYRAVYAYEVDGREYRYTSGVSTTARPDIGSSAEISYSAADPENARRSDGLESRVHWMFIGAGAFALLIGLGSLTVSLVLIVLGIILFRQGRADRREAGHSSGFLSDLMSLASRARSGEIDVEQTAVGQSGASQGQVPDTGRL